MSKFFALTSLFVAAQSMKVGPGVNQSQCTMADGSNGDKILTCAGVSTRVNLINPPEGYNMPVKGIDDIDVDDEMTTEIDNPFLCPNTFMYPGWGMVSKDGLNTMVYQANGDLCTYQSNGDIWCSGSNQVMDSAGAGYALLERDGNFVLKSYDHVAYWSTGTTGSYPAYLTMQNDGNLCLYSGTDGSFIWCSSEDGSIVGDDADDTETFDDAVTVACNGFADDDYYTQPGDDDAPLYAILTGNMKFSTAGTLLLMITAAGAAAAGTSYFLKQKRGYTSVANSELPSYQSTL